MSCGNQLENARKQEKYSNISYCSLWGFADQFNRVSQDFLPRGGR